MIYVCGDDGRVEPLDICAKRSGTHGCPGHDSDLVVLAEPLGLNDVELPAVALGHFLQRQDEQIVVLVGEPTAGALTDDVRNDDAGWHGQQLLWISLLVVVGFLSLLDMDVSPTFDAGRGCFWDVRGALAAVRVAAGELDDGSADGLPPASAVGTPGEHGFDSFCCGPLGARATGLASERCAAIGDENQGEVPGTGCGAEAGPGTVLGCDADAVVPVGFDFDGDGGESGAEDVGVEAGIVAPAVCGAVGEDDAVNGLVDGGVGWGIVWNQRCLLGVEGLWVSWCGRGECTGPEGPCTEEEFGDKVIVVVEELVWVVAEEL